MNFDKLLAELKTELANVDEAIQTLERLAYSSGRRRGRPPAFISEAGSTPRKKRRMSAETRAKMAAAQKKRWAAKA